MKALLFLLALFLIITAFSLLTVWEVNKLREAGFDVVAHLKITNNSGKKWKFFFEAVGVVAFVIGQPIVLTILLVWATNNINPVLWKNIVNVLMSG
jgi:hypothetical protein